MSTLVNTAPARVKTVPIHFNCQVKFLKSGLVNIHSRRSGITFEASASCPIVSGSAIFHADDSAWTAEFDNTFDPSQLVKGHALDRAGFCSRTKISINQFTLISAESKSI